MKKLIIGSRPNILKVFEYFKKCIQTFRIYLSSRKKVTKKGGHLEDIIFLEILNFSKLINKNIKIINIISISINNTLRMS
jgi:hypothetical protein